MKNLALVGYGKLGKLVGELAPEYDFDPVLKLTSRSMPNERALTGIDVAIELTNPHAAAENLLFLAASRVPTVAGTTGWLSSLEAVSAAFHTSGTSLVWSPNFSVGAAVFRRLVETAGLLLKSEDEYGAWAWEIHHDSKKDAPSGTLVHLVEALKQSGYGRSISTSSNRAGRHPGTHEIGFDSAADTITLRHVARSREGFARGALKAARWISERQASQPGVFTFDEVLFGPK